MIPTSLSASALHVASLCMKRFEVGSIERIPTLEEQTAATLGSTVHLALQDYVQASQIDKKHPEGLDMLELYYKRACSTLYIDIPEEVYDDGWEMLKRWFARTSFDRVQVISTEVKKRFNITTESLVTIPISYIFDRLDYLGDGVYRVVDYKSQRWGLNLDELRKKIQARIYSMAARMEYPEAKHIWIEFDFLRHDVVGTRFTIEDDRETFNDILNAAEVIVQTTDPQPTLNSECGWCPIKTTCPELRRHIDLGGVMSLDFDEAIDLRAQFEYQQSGINAAKAELDKLIINTARTNDIQEYKTAKTKLTFPVRKTRTVDPDLVEKVVGKELFDLYGGKTLTVPKFTKLLANPELTPSQVSELGSLVNFSFSEPKVKVEATTVDDE